MGLDKPNAVPERGAETRWTIPASMLIVSLLIALAGDLGREWLRYDRVWIAQGEVWRFASAHFAHLSGSHLALNGAGLLLVWFLVGASYSLRHWLLVIAVIVTSMDLAFWTLNPELHWYVGMSGMLHGLLTGGIVARIRLLEPETLVLTALITLKIGWEQFAGPVPGSVMTSGGPVVVDAHLYGALGGILGALVARIRVRPDPAI